LDENYVPVTTADIDLFAEKQKFLYAVLEARVETAKGKAIIRSHEKNYDAQKAYAELTNYHLTSNTALFGANKIMEYLTSARINDGSWHGSVENFIINWQNQFRL
jgi:lipopolysaccharide export system protein LptA